uniref:Uncharacterized protein n=1 Tax=Rhizophora mucronata TaxID=61149 RepID=A0A2P2MVN4_RHIMU
MKFVFESTFSIFFIGPRLLIFLFYEQLPLISN